MKDQHTKIKGYRDLSQAEIDLMNKIKSKGEEIQELLLEVGHHLVEQPVGADADELARLSAAEPQRWRSLAKTKLQEGLMALTRAVAQPTTF